MSEEYKCQIAELSAQRDKYKRERDELIDDLATVRGQRNELKRKLDEVEELFVGHINYKLSVSHNYHYIKLRHKLDEIIHSEKENR